MDQAVLTFEWLVHFDAHLRYMAENFGGLVYGALFLIIFCETGLVVTPFLPGDSLLFISGTLAAAGVLEVWTVGVVIFIASILGDAVNYQIGTWFGAKVIGGKGGRYVKREHALRAKALVDRYGAQAVVLSRFMPIVRTFVPFMAGAGRMDRGVFLLCNVTGAFVWTLLLVGGGFFFGNLRVVQENYELVMVSIVGISFLPLLVSLVTGRSRHGGSVRKCLDEER